MMRLSINRFAGAPARAQRTGVGMVVAGLVAAGFGGGAALAQATIDATPATGANIAARLDGTGVTITSGTIPAANNSDAATMYALFTNGVAGSNLGIDRGVALSTGTVTTMFSTNNLPTASEGVAGTYNDADLTSIEAGAIYNVAVVTMNVTLDPYVTGIQMRYQFGSDEYPDYAGSTFNDLIAIILSGPGITGRENIALAPNGANTDINSINFGVRGCQGGTGSFSAANTTSYLVNGHSTSVAANGRLNCNPANQPGPFPYVMEWNGMTTPLTASRTGLTPGATYQLKVAVADVLDNGYDSGAVFEIVTGTYDRDYGDAPASYGAPVHDIRSDLKLGASVTGETSGYNNANAAGDTGDDGVVLPQLVAGVPASIPVTVTGTGGRLSAYIDWNGNGSFAAAERIANGVTDGGAGDTDGTVNGVILLSVTPPVTAVTTQTFARFRIASATTNQTNAATDGEVEDYALTVQPNQADLSLTKVADTPSAVLGQDVTFTLTLRNDGPQDAPGVVVSEALPPGLSFVSAVASQGIYDPVNGIWVLGTVANGAAPTLELSANVTQSGTLTNTAQVAASALADPDSTPGDGAGDDYAAASVSVAAPLVIDCGTAAPSTGRATGGTGAYRDEIFWFDWSCGGTTSFPIGSLVTRRWNVGDGLVITGQISAITQALRPYDINGWAGNVLDDMYSGILPIGLANAVTSGDPSFRVSFTATLDGDSIPADIVFADAEDSGGTESLTAATNGTPWQPIEANGTLFATFSNGGRTVLLDEPANAAGGTLISLSQDASDVQVDMQSSGASAIAFGTFMTFDRGDLPTGFALPAAHYMRASATGGSQPGAATAVGSLTTATLNFGSALRLGTGIDADPAENASADALGDDQTGADDEDGVTFPAVYAGVAFTLPVSVGGTGGYLEAWIDFDGNGVFDAADQIASGAQDGGAGDADGVVDGVITLSITPPLNATTAATFARFRVSGEASLGASGTAPDGEVEDHRIIIVSGVDLELLLVPLEAAPTMGFPDAVTLRISNAGVINATGVQVLMPLPAGWAYVSDDTGGNYDPATGIWTVGMVISGGSDEVEFVLTPLATGPYALNAQVSAANEADVDSTPANASSGEDDETSLSPVPVRGTGGTIPAQACASGGPLVLDWTNASWTPGAMSGNYSYSGIGVSLNVDDPQGALSGTPNGPTPGAGPFYQGGLPGVDASLIYEVGDVGLANGDVTTRIDFTQPVSGVRLSLFDIDFSSAGPRLERVTVRGYNGPTSVAPILTPGSGISARDEIAVGIEASPTTGGASGGGTLQIGFDVPVSRVEFDFGQAPGTDRTANPGYPGFSVHDISFCGGNAQLSASKTVEVYGGPGAFAVPGNDVIYTITVSNIGTGPSDPDTIMLIDLMPEQVSFFNGATAEFGGAAIGWADVSSGLTFDASADVGFSASTSGPPASFAACNYTPTAGYDRAVTHICFNPKGTMNAGDPDPSFAVSFRARIN